MSNKEKEERIDEVETRLSKGTSIDDKGMVEFNFDTTLEGADVTLDDFKRCQQHLSDVAVPAMAKAVGEKALDHFKQNPDAQQVNARMKINNDVVVATVDREKSIPTADGGSKTTYGSTRVGYKAKAAVGTSGQLKRIKTNTATKMREALEQDA